ncbi:MAG: sigma-70 family RNA polymerase sigma factor [Verrucomicrobiota bacterium]
MDELIKLVKTFRFTAALDQRLRLADEIFRYIEPPLRVFVRGSVASDAVPDVLQEVLKGVATSLRKFEGDTNAKFWGWCYGVARNKISDHFRRRASDRLLPVDESTLQEMLDASVDRSTLRPGERLDLELAMKLLSASKPECQGLLWGHYVQGFDYAEIADEHGSTYDAVRMKIGRCLEEARSLIA